MFYNKKIIEHEEQIKLLNDLNTKQLEVVNQMIETYSTVILHIKDQAQRIEDLETTVQGIIQLTLTHQEVKKSKKKKPVKKVKRDTYVEVGTMEEAKILDKKLNGGNHGSGN